MADISDEALATLRHAYEKVKYYPENKPDGWAHMLNLRQAVSKLIPVQKTGFMDEMVERGVEELARQQSGVDDLDGLEPEFVDQLRITVRAVLEAALTAPRT